MNAVRLSLKTDTAFANNYSKQTVLNEAREPIFSRLSASGYEPNPGFCNTYMYSFERRGMSGLRSYYLIIKGNSE